MNSLSEEIWSKLVEYYQDLAALLPALALAILVFIILLFIANRSRKSVQNKLNLRLEDPLLAKFLAQLFRTGIIILALLIVLKILGLGAAATGLFAGASISAFIIGFAFKDIVEHFLAGIIMAFNRPFRVGDTVELDGIKGVVKALNLRDSQIKTFDGKDVYIPNGNIIKNPVINYTIDGFLRQEFNVGIDYSLDANQAIDIIVESLNSIEGILREGKKAPSAHITELGNSALVITAYYWINTFDSSFSSANLKTIAVSKSLEALEKAGFYLPGDVIELKNYNKEQFNYMKKNEM